MYPIILLRAPVVLSMVNSCIHYSANFFTVVPIVHNFEIPGSQWLVELRPKLTVNFITLSGGENFPVSTPIKVIVFLICFSLG